jgi:adenylate cyclase
MKCTFFAITLLLLFPSINYCQESNIEFDKLLNNWAHFHQKKEYARAMEQAEQAFQLAEKISNKALAATALNRKGKSLIKIENRVKKNRKEATDSFEQSLLYLTGIKNAALRIDNLEQLKWLAEQNKDSEKVTFYQQQIAAVETLYKTNDTNELLAEQVGSLSQQKELLANQKKILVGKIDSLNEVQLKSELLIALQKNQVDSFSFAHVKDSLLLERKELLLAQQSATLALQESQINLQKSQRNLLLALAAIIGFLGIGAVMRYVETKKHNLLLETKNQIIEAEKKRSDELLLNILPVLVAKELKATGVAKAKRYEEATVLFTDFVNFSGIAKTLSPEQLVFELDLHFKAFDEIIGKYQVEKIKTIGDAYMCVGGLPDEANAHPRDVIKAALEIQDFLSILKAERIKKGMPFFEARIGIHTGPLVAGVVGSKKFAYDIWGDTVNIAARLEEKSAAGKVNISSTTFAMVGKEFDCEDRGKLPIKNLGEVGMYFVKGAL